MARTSEALSASDGSLMRFEVRDGNHRISCAVSAEALEVVSGLTAPSSVLLRRGSFDRFRTLIDAAAKLKVRTLNAGFVGPLVLTSEDLRSVPPPPGTPSFGSSGRGLARARCGVDGPAASSEVMPGAASAPGNRDGRAASGAESVSGVPGSRMMSTMSTP